MIASGTRLHDRVRRPLKYVASWFERWDWLTYLLVAGVCILAVACLFYSSLRLQTLYAQLWSFPQRFDQVAQQGLRGDWSAPLDDVFIHFDFARATARGYPFQWIEGNGYSSGGTSLLYPFTLALGYWLGFRSLDLMVWAGIIACVSVLGLLMAARRLFDGLPRWTTYLAPVSLLCTGVLNWTLFSGMEVALFLGIWGGALVSWDELCACDETSRLRGAALTLGIACLLLVATRPEAAATVALFSLSASYTQLRRAGRRAALTALSYSAVPGACLVIGQALANRLLTGDFTAAGALAKLEMHHPYLTGSEVWSAWLFHVIYQVRRVSEYHLSELPWLGYSVALFALLALVFRRTRRYALLLWASAIAWIMVVALNGQVRWQNERYTMPALAWLLLAAGMGLAAALTHGYQRRAWRVTAPALCLTLAGLFLFYQAPRFRDQVWFFGRASRNILDQHWTAGLLLREGIKPTPKRVLLSDAGAIPYAADVPAIDLIGLGGYRRLPFARATRHGAPGGLELIERLPPQERPDVLALYPSWWHTFPLWFGRRVEEVPVRGNVICGGASKVLYRADWSALSHGSQPFRLDTDQRLVDSLDLVDVISERAHDFRLDVRGTGHATMKLLPHPDDARSELWDGGRLFAPHMSARFVLRGLSPGRAATLLFRVAPAQQARFEVMHGEVSVGMLTLEPADSWQEVPLELAAKLSQNELELRLLPREGGFELYHIWLIQKR